MRELTRRTMIGATFALVTWGGKPLLAQPESPALIDLPSGAMVLSRRLERPLMDGERIVVTRSWVVQFALTGQAIMVGGRQIEAEVEAPPKLAGLARIEEARPTDGMFPITLSPTGKIVSAGSPDNSQALADAVAVAQDLVRQSARPEDEKQLVLRYLAVLQAAGNSVVEMLPPDLFFPPSGTEHELRRLDLPGGQQGQIELIRISQPADGQKWLGRSERRIITSVAGTSVESQEIWTMRPL